MTVEGISLEWYRVTDPDQVVQLFRAWFSGRMLDARGSFGLLLTTGDVMRITSIKAIHQASDGTVLADVLLDHAGPPQGADLAWRTKHFLGCPAPGAMLATVNLAHVVAAVEFVASQMVEPPDEITVGAQNELPTVVETLGVLPPMTPTSS